MDSLPLNLKVRMPSALRQAIETHQDNLAQLILVDLERESGLALTEHPEPLEQLEPRKHQLAAIAAVVTGLKSADRGQLVMACGTGKSYTTYWVKEALGARRTLVLVPSLNLLSQLLGDWQRAAKAASTSFEALCVCSDDTVVSKKDLDETSFDPADLHIPVVQDPGKIQAFLAGRGNRVVFSTYQSSFLIAAAQADQAVPAFDLVVADEAHRCAGKVDGQYSAVLDADLIRSRKRVFATATPRIYSSKVVSKDTEVEVVGMDNVAAFGRPLYTLPFGKAIDDKLLTDYQVVIIGVDNPAVKDAIATRKGVRTPVGECTDAAALAAQIGLLKAIADYDLKRVITFSSRVARAASFAADLQRTMSWVGQGHRPKGVLRADYVSGEMSTRARGQKLQQLRDLADCDRRVLSNARCLSEGIDLPALDGVAFIDPRGSTLDVIQAVGRAIRKGDGKTIGTIVLPVFLESGADAEEAIKASNFQVVWDVLNALKAHDDDFAQKLSEVRGRMGREASGRVDVADLKKIKIHHLDPSMAAAFGAALRTQLVQRTTESWDYWIGLLDRFVTREGHALVPDRHVEDGRALGHWIVKIRSIKDELSAEKVAQLEERRGWGWAPRAGKWGIGFQHLKAFEAREGHGLVQLSYVTVDGYALGRWVMLQRNINARDEMLAERKALLEGVVGWKWNVHNGNWNETSRLLKAYEGRHGHTDVPLDHVEQGVPLGAKVRTLRGYRSSGTLAPEREAFLEKLKGWDWKDRQSTSNSLWSAGFESLKIFEAREHHCRVPAKHIENGYRLGQWVIVQRYERKADRLSADRVAQLNTLGGWLWEAKASAKRKP